MNGEESVVCDSSALISLTDSCFLPLLYELKKRMRGGFLITPVVRYESIEHPMKIREHAMAAIRLLNAERDGVIQTVAKDLKKEREEVLWITNNLFIVNGRPLNLVQAGEAEALALAAQAGVKNILIDERTTRMLIEAPLALKEHMEKEFEGKVEVNEEYLGRLGELTKGLSAFRSCELVALAFERGYFKKYGEAERQALEAALYTVKFAGCGVSFEEIESYLKGV
ncbi:MAG: hypothetical protein QXH27_04050 [Candidatus Micrarchaeia archaeon]